MTVTRLEVSSVTTPEEPPVLNPKSAAALLSIILEASKQQLERKAA